MWQTLQAVSRSTAGTFIDKAASWQLRQLELSAAYALEENANVATIVRMTIVAAPRTLVGLFI
jgi:hypothetical protein